ncbi:MAG: LCP family protein [Actinomycetota bacterium]
MNPFLGQQKLTNYRRTWGQRLILVLNIVLIAATLSAAALLNFAGERALSVNRVALDRSLTDLDPSPPGERVINVLLVGSDSSANLDPDDPIQIGRQGERLGDVIIVAHLDERSGQVALLSLPRDLWVPIAGTERSDRINRAFLTGGAATLIDTIEEAFGFPIHHYVNVDFAGFQGLVEAVETVEVPFETAARDWNVGASPVPRSQTGFLVAEPGCHSLGPEEALAYVRSRYYQTRDAEGDWVTDPTSDLGRIRRQQDFLQRLLHKAIERGARNPLVLRNLIDTGIENVAIDHELTPALLLELSNTYRSFEPGELQTYTFPVVDGTVGSNRVLIPQYDQAGPLLELFDGEPFDSPETVEVTVVYAAELQQAAEGPARLPSEVRAVVDGLDDAGFDLDAPQPTDVPSGIEIRHSRDGAAAAALVAAALGRDGATAGLVEVGGLSGRNVVVAVGAGAADGPLLDELAAPAWTGLEDGRAANELVAGPEVLSATGSDEEGRDGPEGLSVPPDLVGDPTFTAQAKRAPQADCGP